MSLFFNQLLSAVIQVIIFTAIPFLWWIVSARKKESFFYWIGVKPFKIADKRSVYTTVIIVCFLFMGLSLAILHLLKDVELATSEFSGLGIVGLPSVLIYGFIKTGLSEELLFRGFILKRLASKIGFTGSNVIQSVLFGLIHGVMFFNYVNAIVAIVIIAFTGSIGWFMGYINEKKADGSILPSWLIHGLANTFSSIIALFSII